MVLVIVIRPHIGKSLKQATIPNMESMCIYRPAFDHARIWKMVFYCKKNPPGDSFRTELTHGLYLYI